MRTEYTVRPAVQGSTTDLYGWRIMRGAFTVFSFTTTDRRVARRVVRMARRLGYDVHFGTR